LPKHEPSAHSPWQKTIPGLLWVAFIFISPLLFSLGPNYTNSNFGPHDFDASGKKRGIKFLSNIGERQKQAATAHRRLT
jgi:hypothetical protein